MQKLILIGNLGEDAVVSDLPNGKQVINFSIAVTEKIKEEKVTTWYRCAYFNNNVSIAPYLKKGSKVALIGKPAIDSYTAQDGTTKSNLKCFVYEIELLNSQTTQNSEAPRIPQASPEQAFEPVALNIDDSDIPF